MRRITLVAPSLQQGGLQRAITTLANYFQRCGHKVRFVALYKLEQFYQLHPEIEIVEPPFRRREAFKLVYYLRAMKYLRTAVNSGKPDAVLSFGDYANGLVLLSLAGRRFPIFVSDRSSPAKTFPPAVQMLRRLMYRRADGIIAQTERAALPKRAMVGQSAKIRVIPNPVRDVQRFAGVERRAVVLAVARHYRVKGLDRLIQAFAMVNAPDWDLHVAGAGGPESMRLHQLVDSCGLTGRVRFLGKVDDMDRLYAKAGIFVLPSRTEGFPNALCEAMAAGVPSVSFDIVAGPREIITHGVDGLLVEDGNLEALAAAMQALIDDKNLRDALGAKARSIQVRLSLEKIGQQYQQFLFDNIK